MNLPPACPAIVTTEASLEEWYALQLQRSCWRSHCVGNGKATAKTGLCAGCVEELRYETNKVGT